jgi:hypothetical protein
MICAVGSVIMASAIACAAAGKTDNPESRVELGLALDTLEPTLGMPMFAKLVVKNTSRDPIVVSFPGFPVLELARKGNDLGHVSYEDGGHGGWCHKVVIKGNDSYVTDAWIVLWFKGRRSLKQERRFLFPEVGTWCLRAGAPVKIEGESGSETVILFSETVEVNVQPAAPGFEEFSKMMLDCAYTDGSVREESMPDLEKCVAAHPQGPYSAFCKYVILKFWAEGLEFFHERLKKALASDRLSRYARSILEDVGPSRGEMSEIAYYTLAFSAYARAVKGPEAERADRVKEGDAILAQFKERFPQSLLLKDATSLHQRIMNSGL